MSRCRRSFWAESGAVGAKNSTPVARPVESVITRATCARVTSVQRPGGEGARLEGVVRAVARIGRAGEADALAALHAGCTAVVGLGVDGERGREVVPAEVFGSAGEPGARGRKRDGWERVGAVAGRVVRCRVVAGDADLVLGAFIERRDIGIGDRPVGERTAGGRSVAGGHAEIVRMKTPRLHAPNAGAAADGECVVVVVGLMGKDGAGPTG